LLATISIALGLGAVSPATAAVFNVNRTSDGADSNPGNGTAWSTAAAGTTLRAAIEEANALPGHDTIHVPAGTYTLTLGTLYIEDDVTIVGAGDFNTVIDADGTGTPILIQAVEYLVGDAGRHKVWSYDRNGQLNGTFAAAGAGGLASPVSIRPIYNDDDDDRPADVLVTGSTSGVHRFRSDGVHEVKIVNAGADFLADAVAGPSSSGTVFSDSIHIARYFPAGRIDKVGANGMPWAIFAPNGGPAGLVTPNNIVFRSGKAYVSDASSHRVLRYHGTTGAFEAVFTAVGVNTPRGMLFAPDGSLLVSSWGDDRVARYDGVTGAFLGTLVAAGSGGLDRPTDLVLGPDGSLLVVSSATRQVLRYRLSNGAFLGVWAQGDSPTLDRPSGIMRRIGVQHGPRVTLRSLTLAGAGPNTGYPGGIYNGSACSLTLDRCTIRDNEGSSFGGGIGNWGTLVVRRSWIRDNSLPEGGGGQTSQGGGIFNVGQLVIEQSAITGNLATRGGGISQTNKGRTRMVNTTVSGNRAWGGGGGLRNVSEGRFEIAYSTITLNRANEPGGIGEGSRLGGGVFNDGPDARIWMAGTILAGNTDNRWSGDADYSPDGYSPETWNFTSERSNLVGIVTPNFSFRDAIWGTPTFGNVAGTPAAPVNANLAAFNSATRAHMPNPGSPAIDAAISVSSSPLSNRPARDQRNYVRPADGDGNGQARWDIGAIERGAKPGFDFVAPTVPIEVILPLLPFTVFPRP
jgi:hypothetical protein